MLFEFPICCVSIGPYHDRSTSALVPVKAYRRGRILAAMLRSAQTEARHLRVFARMAEAAKTQEGGGAQQALDYCPSLGSGACRPGCKERVAKRAGAREVAC